jgi:nucleoside-diphosphate-sugar epimerase
LIDAGHADQPMTVIDGATGRPVIHVASIAQAALLTVKETDRGPRFVKWEPHPGKVIYGEVLEV